MEGRPGVNSHDYLAIFRRSGLEIYNGRDGHREGVPLRSLDTGIFDPSLPQSTGLRPLIKQTGLRPLIKQIRERTAATAPRLGSTQSGLARRPTMPPSRSHDPRQRDANRG